MKRSIQDIYAQYTIPPQLQLHQRRVAAVGKLVAEAHDIDVTTVVTACLLHDMGNIIKFKLDRFPEFLEPEGKDYWEKVQQHFFDTYGRDEHLATLMICDELGVSETVLQCIRAIGMTQVHHNLTEGTMEEKVTNYADMRIGPRGLISIQDRLADGKARNGYTHDGVTLTEAGFETMSKEHATLETLLSTALFKPSQITITSVDTLAENLKSFILES
jgi:hypothetical protein